jgi:hypothetical protein
MQFLFWIVIAVFYLALAITTWINSRPIKEALAALKTPGDSLVSYSDKMKKEVGLESTLYAAYKTIIITDIIGFVLAAGAAGISVIC